MRSICALLASLLALGVCFASAPALAGKLPEYAEVRAAYRPSDGVLRDRHGVPLATVRLDGKVRRLAWTPLGEISPALIEALLAAEDKRFYSHGGVDWVGVAGALWSNLAGSSHRGASSLSMQLAAMLDPALARGPAGRSFGQKWDQAAAARELESRWNKAEILEAYFNQIAFRGELQGIGAASWGLFEKHPSGLNRMESSILAALIRQPQATPQRVARRACVVAHQIDDKANCDAIAALSSFALDGKPNPQPVASIAPHVARRLISAERRDVLSSLDADIQRFAVQSLKRHLASLALSGVEDGAVLVLDNASGEVLAYVGSSGELSRSAQVDGVTARRQAGSTLKPFLYELAIERKILTAASVLDDTPYDLSTANGLYVPRNYERDFKGPVSVRTSLGSSLNIPAVRTIVLTSVAAFHERLRALGFSTLAEDPEHYGYSLALGAADVTLLDLTNAYRTLANEGRASQIVFSADTVPNASPVLEPGAAFIVGDILSDRGARFLTFGLDNPLATRSWSAVKTGTSKDMRDNWAVGFSDRYTVGVWVGNFSGQPMHDVSGVTGAAPVWADIMNHLHRAQPSRLPEAPAGVVGRLTRWEGRLEATRQEWYLRGTETDGEIAWRSGVQTRPRIAYPPSGAILALDPAIPMAQQKIVLRAEGAPDALAWMLDGGHLGGWPSEKPVYMEPLPGRHRLALIDREGKEIDAVVFEVRGYGAEAQR